MKIVINRCYGGFGVSPEAKLWMFENGYTELGIPIEQYYGLAKLVKKKDAKYKKYTENRIKEELEEWHKYLKNKDKRPSFITVFSKDDKMVIRDPEDRTHPLLIQAIEKFGDKANGACAKLRIIEIPDDIEYSIEEYDGIEHIAEYHRTWH